MPNFLLSELTINEREEKKDEKTGAKREEVIVSLKLLSNGDTRSITPEDILKSLTDQIGIIK